MLVGPQTTREHVLNEYKDMRGPLAKPCGGALADALVDNKIGMASELLLECHACVNCYSSTAKVAANPEGYPKIPCMVAAVRLTSLSHATVFVSRICARGGLDVVHQYEELSPTESGQTPLQAAVTLGRHRIVPLILAKAASEFNREYERNQQMAAIQRHNAKSAKFSVTNSVLHSSTARAASGRSFRSNPLRTCLEEVPQHSRANPHGDTPLQVAIRNNDHRIVSQILKFYRVLCDQECKVAMQKHGFSKVPFTEGDFMRAVLTRANAKGETALSLAAKSTSQISQLIDTTLSGFNSNRWWNNEQTPGRDDSSMSTPQISGSRPISRSSEKDNVMVTTASSMNNEEMTGDGRLSEEPHPKFGIDPSYIFDEISDEVWRKTPAICKVFRSKTASGGPLLAIHKIDTTGECAESEEGKFECIAAAGTPHRMVTGRPKTARRRVGSAHEAIVVHFEMNPHQLSRTEAREAQIRRLSRPTTASSMLTRGKPLPETEKPARQRPKTAAILEQQRVKDEEQRHRSVSYTLRNRERDKKSWRSDFGDLYERYAWKAVTRPEVKQVMKPPSEHSVDDVSSIVTMSLNGGQTSMPGSRYRSRKSSITAAAGPKQGYSLT